MNNSKQDNVSMLRALGVYDEVLEDLRKYNDYSRDYLLTWTTWTMGFGSENILTVLKQSYRVSDERRALYTKAYDKMNKMLGYEQAR